MNCRHVEELLSNHLEGRLAERASRQVAAHLEDCLDCLRLRDEIAAVGQDLRELPDALPGADLRRRAIERWIAERAAAQSGRWRSAAALGQTTIRAAWLTGAAVVLLAALGLVVGRWERHPENQERPRALALRPPAPPPPRFRAQQSPSAEHRHGKLALSPEHPRKSALDAITQALRPNAQHLRPNAQRPPQGDLARLNGDPILAARQLAAMPGDEWDQTERRVRQVIRVRDDFVTIPFPRLAANSNQPVAAAVESYKAEAAIVDARLSREVTLAAKATALSDLCDQLRADTGIRLEAGRSVADEKVTVFCEKMPLRNVMRQLARPFGYTWLRSTLNTQHSTLNTSEPSVERRASSVEYHYELVQDLRSQLLEEELRNRDRNAALLDIDREMSQYRQYLDLSPDEALARARSAPPSQKALLEHYAATGWGVAQIYFRLSPSDLAALRAGRRLTFSAAPQPGEQPLPPELAHGVLQSMRRKLAAPMPDGRLQIRDANTAPNGIALTSVPQAHARVTLWLGQSELGQFILDGDSGVTLVTEKGTSNYAEGSPLASGISLAVRKPQNGAANAAMARDPSLQRRVTVSGVQAFRRSSVQAGNDQRPMTNDQRPSSPERLNARTPERPNAAEKVTSADVLEALHRASGLPIVADYYTRLHDAQEVAVEHRALFDALNHVADALRARWSKEGNWLQFRGAGFFNDRLKEVPNRLLARWAALRREHGALTLEDLLEIVQLSDAQLDAAEMAEGARVLWGLEEWNVARDRSPRPHLRFLATFPPPQRQAAISPTGLAFTAMSLAQQQQFIALALGSQADKLPSLGVLSEAAMRVDYMLPGAFQWRPATVTDGPFWRTLLPSAARARTREAALQAARRIDPQAEPSQIVPTDLALTITHWLGGPEKGFSKPFMLRVDSNGNHGVRAAVLTP